MQPTFNNHDLLLCLKHRLINTNDIVVFNHDGIKIKRVIAKNHDEVTLKQQHVYVNNIRISPYNSHKDINYMLNTDQYFVIGDNFNNSIDSRNFGPIYQDQIIYYMLMSQL